MSTSFEELTALISEAQQKPSHLLAALLATHQVLTDTANELNATAAAMNELVITHHPDKNPEEASRYTAYAAQATANLAHFREAASAVLKSSKVPGHTVTIERFTTGLRVKCTCGMTVRWAEDDGSAEQSAEAHKDRFRTPATEMPLIGPKKGWTTAHLVARMGQQVATGSDIRLQHPDQPKDLLGEDGDAPAQDTSKD